MSVLIVDENNKLCGDVDFEDVKDKVYAITPVQEDWTNNDYNVITKYFRSILSSSRRIIMDYQLNDIVEMKKQHPCKKSNQWEDCKNGC